MAHMKKVSADPQVSHNKKVNPCYINAVNRPNKILDRRNKEICNAYGCSNIAKLSTKLFTGLTVLQIAVCKECLSKFDDITNEVEKNT